LKLELALVRGALKEAEKRVESAVARAQDLEDSAVPHAADEQGQVDDSAADGDGRLDDDILSPYLAFQDGAAPPSPSSVQQPPPPQNPASEHGGVRVSSAELADSENSKWFRMVQLSYERHIAALDAEVRLARDETAMCRLQKRFLEDELQRERATVETLEKVIDGLRHSIVDFEDMSRERSDFEKEKASLQAQVRALQEEKEKLEGVLRERKTQLAEKKKQMASQERELRSTAKKLSEAHALFDSYDKVVKALDWERTKLKEYVLRYEVELKRAEKKIHRFQRHQETPST